MSQARVVELHIDQRNEVKLPPVLQAFRHTAKAQITSLLQGLFDNTDDALFELADRAQSDGQQEMYFDSMRHLRLHRQDLAKEFLQSFSDHFISLVQAEKEPAEELFTQEDEDAEYTLVEQDDLEMTVAVSGIVSKVTSQHSLSIMQLTKRLAAILAPRDFSERANPVGPHVLSKLFADALDSLDINIRVRIIIMKMFERFVMERMGPVYEKLNAQLIKAGVLPDLKKVNRARSTTPKRPVTQSQADVERNQSAEYGFATVQSLLQGMREQQGPMTGQPVVAPGAQMSPEQVLVALSQLQSQVDPASIDIDSQPSPADVYGSLLTVAPSGKSGLGQASEDTVNFVGLLFDYILNDRNLAIPMKALIARLQIPIIKLAIMDQSFFARSTHPARALLNELSSAGIGWSSSKELKRDALYSKIEHVVHTVLNEFDKDTSLFEQLLIDFRDFVSDDSRKSTLVEQRVKDTEHGKAQNIKAKLAVQTVINQKACGLRLPQEAGRFVSDIWSRVLTFKYLKYGHASPHWTAGIAVLDDLLWVLQPLCELSDVERRDEITPNLLDQVANGMGEIGCPQEEVEQFTDWARSHLDEMSKNDMAYLEFDETNDMLSNAPAIDEIILTSVEAEPNYDSLDKETQGRLKQITEGTWVELQENEQLPIRCKLATVVQPGDNYIFVNKRGMKVAEKSRLQLAGLLEKDQVRMIDESQVFDRALQSVIANLRELQRARPQA